MPRGAVLSEVGPIELDVSYGAGVSESRHALNTAGVRVLDHRRHLPAAALVEDRDRKPGKLIAFQDLAAVFFRQFRKPFRALVRSQGRWTPRPIASPAERVARRADPNGADHAGADPPLNLFLDMLCEQVIFEVPTYAELEHRWVGRGRAVGREAFCGRAVGRGPAA